MEIASLIVSIIALAGVGYCVFLLSKKGESKNSTEEIQQIVDESTDMLSKDSNEVKTRISEIKGSIGTLSPTLTEAIKMYMNVFDGKLDKLTEGNENKIKELKETTSANLENMRKEVTQAINELKSSNDARMKEIREGNEKKLDEMRTIVDEKLTDTLDKRITNAFTAVSERLEAVQKSFGEMTKLSEQVGNLNKVFSNVKTRGGWGEVALQSLLEQVLAPEQYDTQYKINPRKDDMVDFVIKMPGKHGEEPVLLPIDSKFPKEDYERLIDASERGSQEEVIVARKALFARVKAEAKSIKDKYIQPPKTTNFAIIYFPTEGLYAEIVKDPVFCDEMQRDYSIIPCGPTVIAALLNSLQVGFTTLKIQKSSGEIVNLMKGFKVDFDKFTGLIEKVRKNAEGVVDSLGDIDKRKELIIKKLNKVDSFALDAEPIDLLEGIEKKDE